jgi:hypothetical protein
MATNGGNEPPTLFAIGQRKTPQNLRGFYWLIFKPLRYNLLARAVVNIDNPITYLNINDIVCSYLYFHFVCFFS